MKRSNPEEETWIFRKKWIYRLFPNKNNPLAPEYRVLADCTKEDYCPYLWKKSNPAASARNQPIGMEHQIAITPRGV